MGEHQDDPGALPPAASGGVDPRAAFLAEFSRLMRRGGQPTQQIEVPSAFGSTMVHASGPAAAPPLLLFPGYQSTSVEWTPLIDALGDARRVYAADPIGDAGGSVTGDRPITTPADLLDWIDSLLDGLGLPSAELGGHSYGAWMALEYAMKRPDRVDRLTLLDPTMAFSPLLKGYIFRAIPVLIRPTAARRRSVIRWETRGVQLDPEWLQLSSAGTDIFRGAPTVPTKVPTAQALSTVTMPVLVVIAGRSRVHHVSTVSKRARGRLPHARVETLAGATHYGLPMTHARQIAELMLASPESADGAG